MICSSGPRISTKVSLSRVKHTSLDTASTVACLSIGHWLFNCSANMHQNGITGMHPGVLPGLSSEQRTFPKEVGFEKHIYSLVALWRLLCDNSLALLDDVKLIPHITLQQVSSWGW